MFAEGLAECLPADFAVGEGFGDDGAELGEAVLGEGEGWAEFGDGHGWVLSRFRRRCQGRSLEVV